MFEPVNKKLERAAYCLENLKTLQIGSQPSWRANLDCFFFETISAKDLFLQEINDKYGLGLERDEATCISELKERLSNKVVLGVVRSIETELSNKNSWLWKLNNYRNSATHRDLLSIGYVASTELNHVEAHLFEDPENPKKGNMELEIIPYCEESLGKMKDFLEQLYCRLNLGVGSN